MADLGAKLRVRVVRHLGHRRCVWCGESIRRFGATTKNTRRRGLVGTVEHLRPIADGGTHSLENTAVAHRRCNFARGRSPWVPRYYPPPVTD